MTQTATQRAKVALPRDTEQADWGAAVLLSPWLWGAGLTVGFYSLIPHIPSHQEFLQRYFCSHWILYAETGLFFLGMSILGRKLIGLALEAATSHWELPTDVANSSNRSDIETATALWDAVSRLPRRLRHNRLIDRVRNVCEFVLSRSGADRLDDHLKYVAELATHELSASYSLVRTIIWAVPILGFLGTVIGITNAIAHVTPDQLESALDQVTAGLAVAFDTTALALALSMVMVFATFVVERRENLILARVEQFGVEQLAPCFTQDALPATPLAAAEMQAADQLLKRTEALINWQTGLWQSALEGLRGRWTETLDQQQSQLAAAMQTGMAATLTSHSQQLDEMRRGLLDGFSSAAGQLTGAIVELREAQAAQQRSLGEELEHLINRLRTETQAAAESQRQQLAESAGTFTEAVQSWRADLAGVTASVQAQIAELQSHGQTLREIAGEEQQLARLQGLLQENLQTVRSVEAFEEAIQSLNAAVHLLTVRAGFGRPETFPARAGTRATTTTP
jgi:biopolymer transport protein ExbB/TolQ